MTDFQDETTRGEQWPLEKIIPYEKNAKKHPKEQVRMLARAIEELGWRYRILVDENGVIISGHGRLEAAKYIGQSTAPVTVIKDLSETKKKELRLADNKVVSNDYDTRMLSEELKTLHLDEGSDLSWLYDERELDFAIEDNGEIDLGSLSDSVSEDLNEHQSEIQGKIDDETKTTVPMSRVFSFSSVNLEQSRQFNLLEKYAESETGLEGAEAIAALSKKILSA